MLDQYKETEPVIYQMLKNAVEKKRYSHAYLFDIKGYENGLSLVFAFVKYLLCPLHKSNFDDCQNCTQCQKIDDGNFTEIKIIQPDGLWIKKEQLDDLQKEFSKKSIHSDKKIYIIQQAEKLNLSAANSLLKFLEEPEPNIVAILVTNSSYQLLDTIVSRCQTIILRNNNTFYQLEQNLEDRISCMLIESRDDFLHFTLEQKKEFIERVIDFIIEYETKKLDMLLYTESKWHNYFKEKEMALIAFDIMIFFYRDVLNQMHHRNIKIFKEYKQEIESVVSKNNFETIMRKINTLLFMKEKVKLNMNYNLLIDKLIIEFEGGI